MQAVGPKRILSNSALKEFAEERPSEILLWAEQLPILDFESELRLADLDKEREIISPPDEIYLLEKALALSLQDRISAKVAPEVVSYKKGASSVQAVQALSAFSMKNDRPIFVLRRDIRSYTDTIPLHPRSRLWSLLESVNLNTHEETLLRRLLRPVLREGPKGHAFSRIQGISTGSSLTPLIANLYLSDLDQALREIQGGFYRRYGDDFVFAHEDPSIARRAAEQISRITASLELEINPKKAHDLLWTRRGGRIETLGFRETQVIPFLGLHLTRPGIRLPPEKMRELLKRFRYRLKRTCESVKDLSAHDQALTLCLAVKGLFGRRGVAQDPYYQLMTRTVTDQGQWRELDREVTGMVASLLSKKPLPYAFRDYSPERLIREFGLKTPGHLRQVYVSKP